MTRRRTWAVGRILVSCVLTCVAVVLSAGARAVAAPPTPDEIYEKLGVNGVSADYVILIDTSMSMRVDNLYGQVLTSLRQFFAALAPQDGVTLVAVSNNAQVIWEGKAGTTPDDLVAKLPPAPTGQYTDLGAGIAAAVEALQQRLTNPIASVVLLTDGQHEPAPGSAYPYTEGYAWAQLIERATKLKQQVNPYAIQLRGQNGAPLLQKVFPQTRVLATDAVDKLTGQLAQPKDTVRAAKARARLANEAKPTVEVKWSREVRDLGDGANLGTVTLRNASAHIPLDVANLSVVDDSDAISTEIPSGPYHLEPGGTVAVPVTIRWTAGPTSWRPLRTVHTSYRLELSGEVTSDWTEVLGRAMGFTVTPALAGTTADGAGTAQRGSVDWWLGAVVVLLVLILVAMRVRWLRLHPVPGGTLVATPLAAAGSGGSVRLQRRRMPINAGSLGIPGTGEVAGRRHRTRAEQVLAITYSGDGSVAGRKIDECQQGGSVDIHDVRFEWRS